MKLDGVCRVIEDDGDLIISGEFDACNGNPAIIVYLDSQGQVTKSYFQQYGYQFNASFVQNGRRYFAGRGLWRKEEDTFINVIPHRNTIYSILQSGDSLILAGHFKDENDSAIGCLMTCDSSFNCSVLPFVDNEIKILHGLAIYDSALMVAGNFDLRDGFKEIAQYKKGQWLPMENGILGGGDEWIDDMVIYHDTLVVAGRFFEEDGNKSGHVMMWANGGWIKAGSNNDGVQIHDLFIYQNQLLASGIIISSEGVKMNNLIQWNGTHWDGIPVDIPHARITKMSEYRGLLYLSGDFKDKQSITRHIIKLNDSLRYKGKLLTDVNSVSTAGLSGLISPNPSDGSFILRLNNPIPLNAVLKLELSDMKGAVVMADWESKDDSSILIQTTAKSGVYILKVFIDGQWMIAKVCIQ